LFPFDPKAGSGDDARNGAEENLPIAEAPVLDVGEGAVEGRMPAGLHPPEATDGTGGLE
jgi:hypothetical protein